ncbi:MAG: Gfo/Idh/MocA family oxidoreductase [Phycisphaerae bacterium]|nr:Gfo/Idh/MocA family oxidoreductase [Phycisphaerae bacterium]
MRKPLKIGLIGLDTSHVEAFSRILNVESDPGHIPGGKVVAGFPGGSPDFDLSINRVEGYTSKLRDEFGVDILDTPQAVAERSDLVFINAVDGRVHRELFEKIVSYGRPTFIDKPFTVGAEDAETILALAKKQAVPVMSCSALRYADNFQEAIHAGDGRGAIVACDVCGPMDIRPPMPGLYWYGCHSVEMLVTAMGAGVKSVRAVSTETADLVTVEWSDGRVGSIRGLRGAHGTFGAVLHRKDAPTFVNASANQRPYYASLLEAILRSLPEGRSDIPAEEMITVIRILDAANESRRTGERVDV